MIEPGSTYVALGSSFAAGPGIPPIVHRGAGRSARNYPHLVAERLGLELVDATVSGATTANVLVEPQGVRGGTMAPQLEAVIPSARLVTVTVGGNDLGYIGGLRSASLRGVLVRPVAFVSRRLADRLHVDLSLEPERLAEATSALAAIVTAIGEQAPRARVLLVDYLTVLGPDDGLPLTPAQREAAVRISDGLAAAFAEAAERTGATLVAASAASRDHAVGSADPWTSGFSFGGVPYHPTAAGMAAVADLVVAALNR